LLSAKGHHAQSGRDSSGREVVFVVGRRRRGGVEAGWRARIRVRAGGHLRPTAWTQIAILALIVAS